MIRVRKLLVFHHDLVKSFEKIIKDKFDDNIDSVDDITKLSITDVRACAHLKF